MDSFERKVACGIAAGVIALAGGITYSEMKENDWRTACSAAHGTVDEEFTGYITTYTQVGNVMVPNQVPTYDLHCMVDGKEVAL